VLLYIQGATANIWKENVLKDLEAVGEFLEKIKKEFGEEDNELKKIAELRKVEQGSRKIKEYVQEFRWTVRRSRYRGRPLIEEFKYGLDRTIWQRLIESELQLGTIEQ